VKPRRIANALFSLALLAFPRAFRRHFGDEMRADFHRVLDNRSASASDTLAAMTVNGLKERWAALQRWSFFPGHKPHLYQSSGKRRVFWDTFRSDVRHTLRMAFKAPMFSAMTVLALALGIGATSAIFAVVNGVLLRPLPYHDADRLVNVWSNNTIGNAPIYPISPANFLDFQKMNTTFESMDAYYTFMTPMTLHAESGTELTYSVMVGANLFQVLGRTAALGRTLDAGDKPGVVVLSDGYWRRRFGADKAIIGKTLDLTNLTVQVVGVMPPDFVFPYGQMFGPSGFTRITAVDMWLPITYSGPQAASHRMLTAQGQLVRSVEAGRVDHAGRGRSEDGRRTARTELRRDQ
jgi:hypothetical protein